MYNASAVPCRAICIATTVIIRVRAIDICSSERVHIARYVVIARINVPTERKPSHQPRWGPKYAARGRPSLSHFAQERSISSGTNPEASPRVSTQATDTSSDCLLCCLENIADFMISSESAATTNDLRR